MHTLSLVIHVTAAALLVGPQVLLFLAVVPSTWLIEDERLRREVTRVVTARYGMIAGIALVALVITGVYQYVSMVPADIRNHLADYRFGSIFMAKMGLFAVFLGLLLFHVLFVARRIGRALDAVLADGPNPENTYALENARRISLMVSLAMVVVAVAVLVLGVMLGSHEFSYAA